MNQKADFKDYPVTKPPTSTILGTVVFIGLFIGAYMKYIRDPYSFLFLIPAAVGAVILILAILNSRRVRIGTQYIEYISLLRRELINIDSIKTMGIYRTGAKSKLKFLSEDELTKTDMDTYAVYIFLAKDNDINESNVHKKSIVIPYGEEYYKKIKQLVG